jgi:hypothetical protein
LKENLKIFIHFWRGRRDFLDKHSCLSLSSSRRMALSIELSLTRNGTA